VFCYRALARCLGDDQPFFGLRPPGLDGECEPLTSVAELAAHLAAQIRAVHRSGRCIVAGYCAGGAIAFEIAHHLVGHGAEVEFVALFAGRYPTWFRTLGQIRHRIIQYSDRLQIHASALATGSADERRRHLGQTVGRLIASRRAPPAFASEPGATFVRKVQDATMRAIRSYTPAYFDGDLSLFLPSARARRAAEGLIRWRALARRVDEHCGPDECEGDTMLLEPHVLTIARLFQRRCGRQLDAESL